MVNLKDLGYIITDDDVFGRKIMRECVFENRFGSNNMHSRIAAMFADAGVVVEDDESKVFIEEGRKQNAQS